MTRDQRSHGVSRGQRIYGVTRGQRSHGVSRGQRVHEVTRGWRAHSVTSVCICTWLVAGTEKQAAKFRAWVTTEASLVVPVEILRSFYVLAWDSLEHMLQSQNQGQGQERQGQGEKGQGDGEDEGQKQVQLEFLTGALDNILATGK